MCDVMVASWTRRDYCTARHCVAYRDDSRRPHHLRPLRKRAVRCPHGPLNRCLGACFPDVPPSSAVPRCWPAMSTLRSATTVSVGSASMHGSSSDDAVPKCAPSTSRFRYRARPPGPHILSRCERISHRCEYRTDCTVSVGLPATRLLLLCASSPEGLQLRRSRARERRWLYWPTESSSDLLNRTNGGRPPTYLVRAGLRLRSVVGNCNVEDAGSRPGKRDDVV